MVSDFFHLFLPSELLAKIPFSTPTAIQSKAIPPALMGQDVFATSQTGSGKTIAYSLPLIAKLIDNPEMSALVLVPTRELASQVRNVIDELASSSGLRTALLVGGQSIMKQYQELSEGARIVIGTPGRVYDHISRESLNLNAVKFIVLDETDRMLDMNFGPQVESILTRVPSDRQTLMFSATSSAFIEDIAQKYLRNPERINADSEDQANPQIEQTAIRVADIDYKVNALNHILDNTQGNVLVFVNLRVGAQQLAETLSHSGRSAQYTHGLMPQLLRDRVIANFRDKTSRILVATDVVGRGIDVPGVECVVNFDLPMSPNDYVHRIGRTGRAGTSGNAVSILTPQDGYKWGAICRHMGMDIPVLPRYGKTVKLAENVVLEPVG